jgi:hypothetical protein
LQGFLESDLIRGESNIREADVSLQPVSATATAQSTIEQVAFVLTPEVSSTICLTAPRKSEKLSHEQAWQCSASISIVPWHRSVTPTGQYCRLLIHMFIYCVV